MTWAEREDLDSSARWSSGLLSPRHKEQPFQTSSPRSHTHALTADQPGVGTRCQECVCGAGLRSEGMMGKTTTQQLKQLRFLCLVTWIQGSDRRKETSDTKLTLCRFIVRLIIYKLHSRLYWSTTRWLKLFIACIRVLLYASHIKHKNCTVQNDFSKL